MARGFLRQSLAGARASACRPRRLNATPSWRMAMNPCSTKVHEGKARKDHEGKQEARHKPPRCRERRETFQESEQFSRRDLVDPVCLIGFFLRVPSILLRVPSC